MHPPGNHSHANSRSKQLNGFGLTVCDLICDILYFPLNIPPGCDLITIVYITIKAIIVLVISIMDYASLSLLALMSLAVWWMILIASGLRQSHNIAMK